MKITKRELRKIIKEELAESDLGPWRAAFEKVPRGERLNPVESELVKLAAGLKRLGIGDKEVDELLDPLTTAVEANVEGELGLEETREELKEGSFSATMRRSATAEQNLETLALAQKTQQSLIDQLKASEDPSEQEKIQRRLKLLLKLVDDLKLG